MVSERARWLARPETLLLAATLVLTLAGVAALYAFRTTTLTVAVAPRDGTEPELIQAFADALEGRRREIRLKILPFDDVRESAQALRDGRADLAVVRPDIALPDNGLTLAVLRDQAMLVAAPEASGLKVFPDLARRRLGIAAHRDADFGLLKTLFAYFGLALVTRPEEAGSRNAVLLVEVGEDEIAAAFAAKRIDALVAVIAPAAPKAVALIAAVQAASRDGRVALIEAADDTALIERFPRQQAVAVPAGLFGGRPKIPAEDVKTLGTSYRLMASRSLSRTAAADVTQNLFELRTAIGERTTAADYMKAPDYETTAAATSAMLPNHPGAIDYFEREQQGLVERYGDLVYLFAILAGGLGSASAWLRQRLARLRRERADVVLDRLLEIVGEARYGRGTAALAALAREIDDLAADFVRDARSREVDARTLSAMSVAIDAARSTVAESRRALRSCAEATAGSAAEAMPRGDGAG